MLSIAVTEQTQVAEARREAVGHARSLGFPEQDVERVALVATELATNLVRHARLGEILLSTCEIDGDDAVQLIALDDGPGMRDPETCLRDGYSTAGGAGTGLGAVRRLSDRFDLYSRAEAGTAILSRLAPRRGRPASRAGVAVPGPDDRRGGLAWDAVVQPKPGEQACGDGWSVHAGETHTAFLMCDGIGHGPLASAATAEAVRLFQKVGGEAPARAMQAIHAALAGTRGAAAAIARLDHSTREIRYCGIGNICTTVFPPGGSQPGGSRRAVSQNGTLGHAVRKLQEFVYPFPGAATLVMHSDGLSTSWDLDGHNGLAGHLPATVAAVLYRRHRRQRDDAAVLVVKST